ncbi:MAG: hypothetical protein ACI8UR_001921 [Natronomonas sp.]|jgi:hypothetical protein|uniref:hypothetical protein n=1 Tax=Natronomonas sp. TaxID=2184060 RepID=UPI003988DD89
MSDFDELAITIGKMGGGPWELTLEGGETLEAYLDEVGVNEERGFHAEGRNDDEEFLVELTTGPQPGGPIRLEKRSLYEDEWEEVGPVVDAAKLD